MNFCRGKNARRIDRVFDGGLLAPLQRTSAGLAAGAVKKSCAECNKLEFWDGRTPLWDLEAIAAVASLLNTVLDAAADKAVLVSRSRVSGEYIWLFTSRSRSTFSGNRV